MKSLLLLALLTLFTSAIQAQSLIHAPETCYRGPFENYDKWVNFLKSKNPGFNEAGFLSAFPKTLVERKMAALDCVDFTYQVDGLTVEGNYLKPRNAEPKSLPVVIYNRGGNAGFGYVVFGDKMQTMSELAEAGYLVIGSQYRGSSRWIDNNGQDEFGGGDVNDVLALRELRINRLMLNSHGHWLPNLNVSVIRVN